MRDPVDRRFVRIAEGQVHLREVPGEGSATPLVLIHASPGSSRGLLPLLEVLRAGGRAPRLLAPDTPGNGDSAALLAEAPQITDYADALLRTLDALGIERAALYGTHTGARIALETAIRAPDRIDRVIFDGIGDYASPLREELLERYAPVMAPDDYGTQFQWAFHFVRDMILHFPHYRRDPEHRMHRRAVPDAATLHANALEVLKALGTYHHAYNAVFAYPTRDRLPELTRPAIYLDALEEIPSLRAQVAEFAARTPTATVIPVAAGIEAKAEAILAALTA